MEDGGQTRKRDRDKDIIVYIDVLRGISRGRDGRRIGHRDTPSLLEYLAVVEDIVADIGLQYPPPITHPGSAAAAWCPAGPLSLLDGDGSSTRYRIVGAVEGPSHQLPVGTVLQPRDTRLVHSSQQGSVFPVKEVDPQPAQCPQQGAQGEEQQGDGGDEGGEALLPGHSTLPLVFQHVGRQRLWRLEEGIHIHRRLLDALLRPQSLFLLPPPGRGGERGLSF